MNCNKSLLSVAILSSLSFLAQAQQSDATQSKTNATDLDTIVVTGIRSSIEKSLDTKREASSHVEAVSAEDIGKLPAKNVADTLREVPGVNISSSSASEGAFDEADRVSLRGTSPSLTQTTVNGHGIATGDWFVLSQVGTVGRSVSYTLLPSEIVDQVVVHKTSEAKLVEGGAAGSVDIITRKPLNFDKPLTLEGSFGAVYSDLPDDTQPQFSGLLNWKNDADTFGVLFQPFYEKRSLRRDGQEVVGGYQTATIDGQSVLYPNLFGATLFEQKRERKGGTIDIQFKASDDLTFDLNGFYSKMKADNYNRNFMIWGSQFVGSQTPDSYTVNNGVLTSASYTPNGTTPYGVYDMISRPGAESSTNYISLNADWHVNDSVAVKFEAGTSHGEGKSPQQDVLETGISPTGGTVGWQMNGIGSAIDASLGDGNTPETQVPSAGWIFGDQGIDVKDKENWFAADSTWTNSEGVFSSLDFGVRYTEHNRHNDTDIGQGPITMPLLSALPTTGGTYPSDFGDGLGGSLPSGIWYYTPDQLAAIDTAYTNRDPIARFNWQNVYGVKEKNGAIYLQGNFEGERWSGNIGVRYVDTSSNISYNQGVAPTSPGAITGSAFGAYLPINVTSNYHKFLPSANFKFDFTDELIGRLAASKTLTRPDYSALAGYVSLEDLGHTGSAGNPYLKPLVSTNFDASLEWYFMPRGLLAASAFYMKMKDYVDVAGTTVIQYKDQQATYGDPVNNPQQNDVYADYTVAVPTNTDAKVKGVELTYQQPIGKHFGANVNYTYADGDTDTSTPVFGTSKNTYNVAGYFENSVFSVRVSYSYRSKFFAGASRAAPFYQDDFGTLAASLGYKINDHLSISLDGLNLNNPKSKYYTDTTAGYLPYATYENGRQYYLNLRAKF